ncbi:Protein of unknown function [Weissella confusa LBAE C39-2]|nr:Protein of unknown function [Weissella confusa LBAE C39-2]
MALAIDVWLNSK